MASATRKRSTDEIIAEAKKAQQEGSAGKVVMPPPDEQDIDDLLGPDPVTKKSTKSRTQTKSTFVARQRDHKGALVAFKTKKGEVIIGHGVQYFVVRFEGRLHYKVAADCVYLPDDWKPGDPIPGEEKALIDIETDLL